jgi:hypothetical protein
MACKLIAKFGAFGIALSALAGCTSGSGYNYYDVGPVTVYREQVVIERPRYYRAPPRYGNYRVRDYRSPRCFGANCYVGATYREDPYYRLPY